VRVFIIQHPEQVHLFLRVTAAWPALDSRCRRNELLRNGVIVAEVPGQNLSRPPLGIHRPPFAVRLNSPTEPFAGKWAYQQCMNSRPEVFIKVGREEGIDFGSQKARFEKRTLDRKPKCPLSCEPTFEWRSIREFRNGVQIYRGYLWATEITRSGTIMPFA